MRSKIGFEFALTAILLTTGFATARLEAQTLQLPAAPPGGLNASKLPDAEGIHLGMTVAQAMAVMKSLFPGATGVLPRYSKYANGPSWVSSITGTSADGHDNLIVFLSMPPNPQQVVFVQRTLILPPGKQPTEDSTVASLRQKYGQDLPVAKRLTGLMAWAYDEQGQTVSVQGPANWSPTDCAQDRFGVAGGQNDPGSALQIDYVPDSIPLEQKVAILNANLCDQHVYVTAQLQSGTIQGTSVVNQIYVFLGEKPLMIRDSVASQQYLAGVLNAKAQQQMKNAQQQKAPTL